MQELEKLVQTETFKQLQDVGKADYMKGIIHLHRAKAARMLVQLTGEDGELKYPDLAQMMTPEMIQARIEIIEQQINKVTTTPRIR
jgi:hypothetical protein